ncbi:serine/threonine-protein kinase [Paludisphaera sp.]|uniref:serine/threonine-protein kinase n=1 Tax=Paludisphaera sp. TaxID=2017432 RepID=UPI00301C6172
MPDRYRETEPAAEAEEPTEGLTPTEETAAPTTPATVEPSLGAGDVDAFVRAAPESLSDRYDLLKLHAKGGMGQVWRARDRQLPREVAIKELQPRVADREDLRARFLVEAEITGRLEHPGIVPIYSLGEDEAGRPYYAMRFVRGHSLVKAIRDFHRARRDAEAAGASPARAWGLEFRLLLRRFVGACEALEYAHGQGCIHRDLKPGNIMVGPYGETLVVDWGLGKILGSGPEPAPAPSSDGDDDERRTPISATKPGDRIGTPQYMSPEQTLGDLERVGPSSDVYSLGATLFELLTGKPPFDGRDPHAITVAVMRGARPPRSVLPSVPAALDAVCARAMAFRREDRYESAGALARDLENWLADEPVSARPEPRRERLARWIRRRRAWAAAAAVALVAVSVAATTAAVAVGRSWRNESAARALAEANFEDAQETVDKYLTRISQDELLSREDSVDMRQLRHDLLREALAYYERFAREHADDDRLKRRLAEAFGNMGVIQLQIATPADAIAPFEAAVATWEGLMARAPDGRRPVAEHGWALFQLGEAREAHGSLSDAQAAYAASVAALRPTPAPPGGADRSGRALASALLGLASIRDKLGDAEGALAAYAEARGLLERLAADRPDDAAIGVQLARAANTQGVMASRRRDHAAALRHYEECRAVCRSRLDAIARGRPRPLTLLELGAIGAANVADALAETGRLAEAEEAYARALEEYRDLSASHPTVGRFRRSLGHVQGGLGYVRLALGRDADALRALEEATETFEALLATSPDDTASRGRLARSLNTIGCIRDGREEHRDAMPEFRRAIAEYRRAIAGAAEMLDFRDGLSHSLANLAEQHADLGEIGAATEAWEEAARAVLDVLRDPAARGTHLPISLSLAITSGEVRLHAGDVDGALARFDEVADAIRATPAADDAARAAAVATLEVRRAEALLAAGRVDQARSILDRLEDGPKPSRGTISEALWLRAEALRRSGREPDARAVEADRAALWTHDAAAALVAEASTSATRACLFGHGSAPLPEIGRRARSLAAAKAADDLRLALALGLADRGQIRANRDLARALAPPEFRDLRDELAFPEFPFAEATR